MYKDSIFKAKYWTVNGIMSGRHASNINYSTNWYFQTTRVITIKNIQFQFQKHLYHVATITKEVP